MPSIEWNLQVWDRDYPWIAHGEEWTQQAEFCGVPYEAWKESLARTFLIPYVNPNSAVVEIGPGHGRWTKYIHSRIQSAHGVVHLVDISQSCLDYCRKKFIGYFFQFHKTDGRTIPSAVRPGSVDFVWSFDTFVHIEEPEIRSYAKEFFRVLKPQGMGVIHHSGTPSPEQRAGGARSLVGARLFGDILRQAGFFVIRQTSEWGQGCNLKLTGDAITIFVKP
jgi:ubiquinone/menaquinone biosynthesis C-methylase UbiE